MDVVVEEDLIFGYTDLEFGNYLSKKTMKQKF